MGPENKREDDDSDNEQQTEILKKPGIGVMDTISIIEIYSHFSKFCAGMRQHIGEASRLIDLDKLSKKSNENRTLFQHLMIRLKILFKFCTRFDFDSPIYLKRCKAI